MRKTPLFLCLMLLAGAARASMVCNYSAGNVTLDASDFAQIAQNDASVTQAYFNKLAHGSKQRLQVCDSRALVRKVKAGSVTNDDFTTTFPNWIVTYWGSQGNPSEQKTVLQAQIDLAASSWAMLFEQGIRAS